MYVTDSFCKMVFMFQSHVPFMLPPFAHEVIMDPYAVLEQTDSLLG